MYPGKMNFIDKSYMLLVIKDDVTNGRISIFNSIFNEYSILDIIFGIGIGSYESSHMTFGYTHNLLLSLILDYGLIGLIFFCSMLIKFFSINLKERNNYLIVLFSISVIHLMFSGTYWQSFEFWLFIFTMNKIKRTNTILDIKDTFNPDNKLICSIFTRISRNR